MKTCLEPIMGVNFPSVDWLRKRPEVFDAWKGLDMRI